MKNARHLGKAILILALLASVTGCFSYAAFVSTTPKLDSERALTAEELDALLVAIRAKLTTMGMIEHPRLEWKKQIADESPESKYRLLDAYIVGPDSDFYAERVSVLQKKRRRGGPRSHSGSVVVQSDERHKGTAVWPGRCPGKAVPAK